MAYGLIAFWTGPTPIFTFSGTTHAAGWTAGTVNILFPLEHMPFKLIRSDPSQINQTMVKILDNKTSFFPS
jgi:hypothetical protein